MALTVFRRASAGAWRMVRAAADRACRLEAHRRRDLRRDLPSGRAPAGRPLRRVPADRRSLGGADEMVALARQTARRSSSASKTFRRWRDVSDRRPILLANARIVDPSRDLDRRRRADRRRRDPRGQARHPRGRRAGRHRDRRLPRRAWSRPASSTCASSSASPAPSIARRSRSASQAAAAGGVTTIVSHARHQPGDRRSGAGRFRAAPRARHRDRARASDGGADQGPRRRGAGRDRPAAGGRRGRLHRRRQERARTPR